MIKYTLYIIAYLCGILAAGSPVYFYREQASDHTARILAIAVNPNLELRERIAAVKSLRNSKDNNVIISLLEILPGEYDALTFEVIEVVARSKDPKSLPILYKMYFNETEEVPGQIRAALADAIVACQGKLKK